MKKTRKLWAFLLAMIMVLSMGMTVMAANTGSITITPPAGTDGDASNTYKIYKVFDADGDGTNISYKLVEGKTNAPAGFSVDSAGNVTYSGSGVAGANGVIQLTADDIAAIAAYVKDADPVTTVTTTGTAAVVTESLANGYYYITTSTGTVVTIDSTNPNATVNDKNTVPTLDKKITDASSFDTDGKKALAQVGTDVVFEATLVVGKGAKGYVFHDTMGAGLNYKNDVTVTGIDKSQYTIKATPDTGDTITITFADGIAEGTEIIIIYSAKVTSDALTINSVKNTAYVSYGDVSDEDENINKTPVSETETYNAKFTVTKLDGNGDPLADAGFVLKNEEGKYYKLENMVVSWVDSIDDATEYTSDEAGNVTSFTGLANGTYTLVEKTVPAGYNKAADSSFRVVEHNYEATNLKQTADVVNNAGAELPETGGEGTTMFYIAGGVLVLVAVVLLVTRKRMSVEK